MFALFVDTQTRSVSPMRSLRTGTHVHPQRGFSIIEVLVALIVLSIGMLGIASLYVDSLRAGRTALLRTQAVFLATDMADRIRANPTAGPAYNLGGANNGCLPTAAGVDSVNCTPAEMAAQDIFLWETQIGELLPAGAAGTVLHNGATLPDTYTITVTWPEAGQPGDATYVLSVQI
jgi:type IV pilus assembly protein PilV